MSRHYYDQPGQSTPRLYTPNYAFGLTYGDTCTTLKVHYSSTTSDPVYTGTPPVRDQTLLVQLTLRTLGEVGVRSASSDASKAARTVTLRTNRSARRSP